MRISAVILALILLATACTDQIETNRRLPFLGPHITTDENGGPLQDTVYYSIPPFQFINQDEKLISEKDYLGSVVVADFFFTHCPTICPIMSAQMARVHDELLNNGTLGEVKLISHTVDSKRDTPDRLKEYMTNLGIESSDHWNMVTGDSEALKYHTETGYMVTAFESDSAAGGFFHTDQFVLLDRSMHIRGYYDGTSTAAVNRMLDDIKILVKE